jgi:hypothetical protein
MRQAELTSRSRAARPTYSRHCGKRGAATAALPRSTEGFGLSAPGGFHRKQSFVSVVNLKGLLAAGF